MGKDPTAFQESHHPYQLCSHSNFSLYHHCHKSVGREDCHETFFSPHRTEYHHIFEESCLPKNSPFVNEIWAAIDFQLLDIMRSPASNLTMSETTIFKIIRILNG